MTGSKKENLDKREMALVLVASVLTWGIFTNWSVSSWIVGVPVMLIVLITPRFLPSVPSFTLRPLGAPRFLIYFIVQSFLGGVDVAWRTLHPRLPIAPGLLTYRLRLSNEVATIFFANTISVMPGTLSVDLENGEVTVHALDRNQDIYQELAKLERRVARLFGEELPDD